MKDYLVRTVNGYGRTYQFDTEQEAIKTADKNQKTRKWDIVVLKKIEEGTEGTLYKECYNARSNKLSQYRYGFH